MPASEIGKPDDSGHDESLCLTCIYGYKPAYRPHTLNGACWCTQPERKRDDKIGKIRLYQCILSKEYGLTSADIESGHRNSPG